MAGKEIAAQKYVMRLSAEEREQLTSLIRSGKRSAQSLTKAHIVLKLDVSEGRDGWSEDKTEKGLEQLERRQHRTEAAAIGGGGVGGGATRKYNPNPARPRNFDGAAEAKLIELARGPAHTGRARWSMSLFKGKVVELNFIERTNDHPLGRALKRSNLEPHIEQQMVMRPSKEISSKSFMLATKPALSENGFTLSAKGSGH